MHLCCRWEATPLEVALRAGDAILVRMLLTAGARLSVRCQRAALFAAAHVGDHAALTLLDSCAADLSLRNYDKVRLAQVAASREVPSICRLCALRCRVGTSRAFARYVQYCVSRLVTQPSAGLLIELCILLVFADDSAACGCTPRAASGTVASADYKLHRP